MQFDHGRTTAGQALLHCIQICGHWYCSKWATSCQMSVKKGLKTLKTCSLTTGWLAMDAFRSTRGGAGASVAGTAGAAGSLGAV